MAKDATLLGNQRAILALQWAMKLLGCLVCIIAIEEFLRGLYNAHAAQLPFNLWGDAAGPWALFAVGVSILLTAIKQPHAKLKPVFISLRTICLALPLVIGGYAAARHFWMSQSNLLELFMNRTPHIPLSFTASLCLLLTVLSLFTISQRKKSEPVILFGADIPALVVLYLSGFAFVAICYHLPLLYHFHLSWPLTLGFTLAALSVLLGTVPYKGLLIPLFSNILPARLVSFATLAVSYAVLWLGVYTLRQFYQFYPGLAQIQVDPSRLYLVFEIRTIVAAVVITTLALRLAYYLHQAITSARESQAALQRESLMSRILKTAHQSLDLQTMTHVLITEIRAHLQADRCFVVLYPESTDDFLKQPAILFDQVCADETIMLIQEADLPVKALRSLIPNPDSSHPLMVMNVSHPDDFPDFYKPYATKYHVQSALAFEITYQNIPYGRLVLHQTTSPRIWKTDELSLLESLLVHFGVAFHQAMLFAALSRTEKRLKRIIDSNMVGIIFSDMNTGLITQANEAFLQMTGYTAEDIQAGRCSWKQMTPKEYWRQDEMAIDAMLRKGVKSPFEKQYLRKDGKPVDVLLTGALLEEKSSNIICFVLDISQQKAMEKQLKEAEERYRLVVECAKDGVWDWDMEHGTLYWSDHMFTMLGLTPGTFVPTYEKVLSLVHPEDVSDLVQHIQTTIEAHQYFQTTYRMQHACGRYHYFFTRGKATYNEAGHPIRISGLMTDITEQKEIEMALRESEARFRMMSDTAPVMIWMTGTDTTRTYFNKPWLEFTGRSLEQELGNGWAEGIHPEDRERCLNQYLQAFHQREAFKMEYRLRRHDGEYRWILNHGIPRYMHSGEFVGYIGSCIDITDRKEAETALKQAKELAESISQKKSQFLAVVSHELRTPLNAILGYSEMLESGYGGDALSDRQKRYAHNIVASGRHLLALVNDILDLTKAEAGKVTVSPQWVPIRPFVDEMVTMLRQNAQQKQIQIHVEVQPELEGLEIDPMRLRQILLNLLSNAVKFNRIGGEIFIRINQTADTNWFICEIEDTGVGIPRDKMPDLFTDFYQVDSSTTRKQEGTGLGLALTKRLVELQGGTISVESEEGVGSKFTFRLPIHAVPQPTANISVT